VIGRRQDLGARLRERLAHLARDEPCDLVGALADAIRHAT
jgi:hypothetical protein